MILREEVEDVLKRRKKYFSSRDLKDDIKHEELIYLIAKKIGVAGNKINVEKIRKILREIK